MPRCRRCGNEHETDELVRHEHESLVLVHCPDCKTLLGEYNSHA